MKNLISIVVAAALGFAAAYFFLPKAESAKPVAKSGVEPVASRPEVVLPQRSAEQMLKHLVTLDPAALATRPRVVRQIIHDLEGLAAAGDLGMPAMREFMAQGDDINYILDENRAVGPGAGFWDCHPGQPLTSGLILPPTLRMSIADVYRYIGTEEAQISLGLILTTTKHGVEIAYASQILESLCPGKYTDVANEAARNYILNPPQHNPVSKWDALAEGYLFEMLAARGDTSLVQVATSKIVSSTGNLNPTMVGYLSHALKEKAMPILYQKYNESQNSDVRNNLTSLSLRYVGVSDQADTMFRDLMNNESVDPKNRAFSALMVAGGGFGAVRGEVPNDPAVIAKRVSLLQGLSTTVKNDQVRQAILQAIQALTKL